MAKKRGYVKTLCLFSFDITVIKYDFKLIIINYVQCHKTAPPFPIKNAKIKY